MAHLQPGVQAGQAGQRRGDAALQLRLQLLREVLPQRAHLGSQRARHANARRVDAARRALRIAACNTGPLHAQNLHRAVAVLRCLSGTWRQMQHACMIQCMQHGTCALPAAGDAKMQVKKDGLRRLAEQVQRSLPPALSTEPSSDASFPSSARSFPAGSAPARSSRSCCSAALTPRASAELRASSAALVWRQASRTSASVLWRCIGPLQISQSAQTLACRCLTGPGPSCTIF
jgi:hypothetical protein